MIDEEEYGEYVLPKVFRPLNRQNHANSSGQSPNPGDLDLEKEEADRILIRQLIVGYLVIFLITLASVTHDLGMWGEKPSNSSKDKQHPFIFHY